MNVNPDDIQENKITAIEIDDRTVLLTRIDGKIHAFSARCPHASGDLREGELHRGRISCPTHGWKFDIRSGRCFTDEDCRLRKFRISEAHDQVTVSI